MNVTPEILEGVKSRLSESGEFSEIDATLSGFIADVIDYMSGAGVSDEMIASHIGLYRSWSRRYVLQQLRRDGLLSRI